MTAPNTQTTNLTKYLGDGNPDQSVAPVFTPCTVTALADAAATLTAAQLMGGMFTITPGAGRALTLDTAANLATSLGGAMAAGISFSFTVVCLAAFAATITTATGWTLVGSMAVNNVAGTFKVVVTSATTATCYRVTG